MSFIPAKRDLVVFEDATFHYRFIWKIQEGNKTTTPNVENFIGKWTITPVGSQVPWREITQNVSVNGSVIQFNRELGSIDLIISEKDTEEIGWTKAKYKLLVRDGKNFETYPLLVGHLQFRNE